MPNEEITLDDWGRILGKMWQFFLALIEAGKKRGFKPNQLKPLWKEEKLGGIAGQVMDLLAETHTVVRRPAKDLIRLNNLSLEYRVGLLSEITSQNDLLTFGRDSSIHIEVRRAIFMLVQNEIEIVYVSRSNSIGSAVDRRVETMKDTSLLLLIAQKAKYEEVAKAAIRRLNDLKPDLLMEVLMSADLLLARIYAVQFLTQPDLEKARIAARVPRHVRDAVCQRLSELSSSSV
jgi:hypothetical protein